ncbi:MAG: hypothetical protein JNM66_27185 [Bryobacterales bacterium]|nr:hypothetical protein [Bryobacterales bacterium]
MKRLIFSLFVLAGSAWSQSLGPLVIDLKSGAIFDLGSPTPTRFNATHTIPYATVQVAAQTGCPETPFRALATVNLTPGNGVRSARRLRMTVEYEGPSARAPRLPQGWTTHIGDDPANDGFGGGGGLNGVAEAHVLDQNMYVYSAAFAAGEVDRIAYQELRLAKGVLHFDVADQYFSWGQPFNEINTTFGKKLFAVGGTGNDSRIYVGLNRVVSGRADRVGCGAKRAILEFQP